MISALKIYHGTSYGDLGVLLNLFFSKGVVCFSVFCEGEGRYQGMYCWKGIMAGSVSEDNGVGRSLEAISSSRRCQSALEVTSSSQRCQSAHSLAEWRSCEQVENGTPSTSPPYWDTDDGDDCGMPMTFFLCLFCLQFLQDFTFSSFRFWWLSFFNFLNISACR